MTDFEARRRMLRARRAFRRLLDRSSLADDRLWVDCPEHGRQARDPFEGGCILCRADKHKAVTGRW